MKHGDCTHFKITKRKTVFVNGCSRTIVINRYGRVKLWSKPLSRFKDWDIQIFRYGQSME